MGDPALLSTQFSEHVSMIMLLFATGAIFPIALLVANLRGEKLISSDNPLAKLMGYGVDGKYFVGRAHSVVSVCS